VKIDALDGLLKPKSVAVVGASATPGKIGYTVIQNLQKDGFKGKLYPINPTATEILGYKVYPNVASIPEAADAAIITVPAKFCLEVVDECGRKGIKNLIIITSGFSEVGDKELEEKMVETAHKYGSRILGPNIVGVCSNSEKFNGSFAPFLPLEGKSSLISQSGALLIAIDASSYIRGVGFDKLISIGNMADIDFADLVTWLDKDEATS